MPLCACVPVVVAPVGRSRVSSWVPVYLSVSFRAFFVLFFVFPCLCPRVRVQMMWADSAYYFPTYLGQGYVCKTNLPASTSMRGPGVTQSLYVMECVLDQVGAALGMDPVALRTVRARAAVACHPTPTPAPARHAALRGPCASRASFTTSPSIVPDPHGVVRCPPALPRTRRLSLSLSSLHCAAHCRRTSSALARPPFTVSGALSLASHAHPL
jgi:hypothetical protein